MKYVDIDFKRKTIHVRESFLVYVLISQKDAESLAEDILKQIENDKMGHKIVGHGAMTTLL